MTEGTTMTATEPLLRSLEDGVLTLTLNRPDRLNAVDGGLHDALTTAIADGHRDPEVRAFLIRGEGRAFCVGGDVKGFAAQAEDTEPPSASERVLSTMHGRAIIDAFLSTDKPIVSAVQGYAMGLGATIALFADVVVAAEDAQFADTHVNVGLVAGDGGAVVWPLLMPFSQAKYYLMTGERISGTEAERLGMVMRAVPADDLLATATTYARKLAAGAPQAVRGTKATANLIMRERVSLVLDHGLLLEGATFVSDDHREASEAFVQKREPVFRGR